MTYAEALLYLTGLQKRGWRMGLDRMFEFLRRSGLTDAIGGSGSPQFIHVAGTNGKGSVTAYMQSILKGHGYVIGGFFSPFVYDIRERIQVDCRMLSEAEFAEAASALQATAEGMAGTEFDAPTEFEFKTAMGFWTWRQKGCAWVALETGLGGRLDATNVVAPASCAIVSIGLDHQEFLGDTLAAIAGEKAGILKAGVPAVIGQIDDPSALQAIMGRASELDVPLWRYGHEFRIENGLSIITPMGQVDLRGTGILGAMQPHNAAIAVAAIQAAGVKIDPQLTAQAIAETRLPGRFQRFRHQGVDFILDGAHNADAARVLRQSLEQEGVGSAVLLAGMLEGHDPREFFGELQGMVAAVHLAPINFHRARDPQKLASEIKGLVQKVTSHASVEDAIRAAIATATPVRPVLVTGSFYLVGEVGRAIGADKT